MLLFLFTVSHALFYDTFRQYDVSVHYVQADLSKTDEALALCQKVDKIYPNGIDIVVNNSGKFSTRAQELNSAPTLSG